MRSLFVLAGGVVLAACITVTDRPDTSGTPSDGTTGDLGPPPSCDDGPRRCAGFDIEECVGDNTYKKVGSCTEAGQTCVAGECAPDSGDGDCNAAFWCQIACQIEDPRPGCFDRCAADATHEAQDKLFQLMTCIGGANCEAPGCLPAECGIQATGCWFHTGVGPQACGQVRACASTCASDPDTQFFDPGYQGCVQSCASNGLTGAQSNYARFQLCLLGACFTGQWDCSAVTIDAVAFCSEQSAACTL